MLSDGGIGMDKEKLIEAAKLIKKYCYNYGNGCEGCLFSVGEDCSLYNFPEDWIIEEDKQ